MDLISNTETDLAFQLYFNDPKNVSSYAIDTLAIRFLNSFLVSS